MSNTNLSTTVVNLGKYRNRSPSRSGVVDENGLVFLPPKNAKRVMAWRQKLQDKGFEVPEIK